MSDTHKSKTSEKYWT